MKKSTKSKNCREGILNDVKVVSGGLNSVFIAPKDYEDIGQPPRVYSQQSLGKQYLDETDIQEAWDKLIGIAEATKEERKKKNLKLWKKLLNKGRK